MNDFLMICATVGGLLAAATSFANTVAFNRLSRRHDQLSRRHDEFNGRHDELSVQVRDHVNASRIHR